jgi:hypothetical protein
MGLIVLIVVSCLPHGSDCRSVVQQPTPTTNEECNRRAAELRNVLAGTIDDAGYVPHGVTCVYSAAEEAQK